MTSAPVPEEPKKGTHPLVWVAVGCAGLMVVGAIAAAVVGWLVFHRAKNVAQEMETSPVVTTARLIAATNPEIELVEADEDRQVVVFRNTRTGEQFTFDFDDIEEGKIRFSSDEGTAEVEISGTDEEEAGRVTITTDEGTARFGAGAEELPSWLPPYPGTKPQGVYFSETSEGRSGAYTIETKDSVHNVLEYYVAELEGKGLDIAQRMTTTEGAFVTAGTPDGSLNVTLAISNEDGNTQAVVNYTEK